MDRSPSQPLVAMAAPRYGLRSDGVTQLAAAASSPPEPPKRSTALQLRRDEPLGIGLQRLALEQLEIVHDSLAIPVTDETWDRGVHRARKAMKRTRALLRMIRDDLGYDAYRNENVVLRDQARRLSPVRASLVAAQTLEQLVAEYPEALPGEVADELYVKLAARHADRSSALRGDRDGLAAAKLAIGMARQRFASWPQFDIQQEGDVLLVRRRIGESFAEIEPGIRRVYRRGRRALSVAREERTALSFHEWRKRVKYLRYQMESLGGTWPEIMEGLASSLKDLSELLGQNNDLVDLARTVNSQPSLVSSPLHRTRLLAATDHKRRVLHGLVLPRGERVYAERPKEFTARLEAYWHAWRSA